MKWIVYRTRTNMISLFHPPACLPFCMSVCMSVWLSVCLYVYMYVFRSFCLYVSLSVSYSLIVQKLLDIFCQILMTNHQLMFWLSQELAIAAFIVRMYFTVRMYLWFGKKKNYLRSNQGFEILMAYVIW